MFIGIVGSRSFTNYDVMKKSILDEVSSSSITGLVSGGAVGADSLAQSLADDISIPMIVHLPDWATHGKGAGFIRNSKIVEDSDMIFAFWDGESRGTLDTINKAKRLGKTVRVIQYER